MLQATLDLLLCQKKYHEKIERIFQQIIDKKKKLSDERMLSISGNIIHIGAVVNDSINKLENHMKNAGNKGKKNVLNDTFKDC